MTRLYRSPGGNSVFSTASSWVGTSSDKRVVPPSRPLNYHSFAPGKAPDKEVRIHSVAVFGVSFENSAF